MSLITRCPSCSTLFRVVPDQLRISEGWVRCGRCEEVFDGNANLQTPKDSADGPASENSMPGRSTSAAVAEPSQSNAPSTPSVPTAPASAEARGAAVAAADNSGYDWGEVLGTSAQSPVKSDAQGGIAGGLSEVATDATSETVAVSQTPNFVDATDPLDSRHPADAAPVIHPDRVDPVLHISPGDAMATNPVEATHALHDDLVISPLASKGEDWLARHLPTQDGVAPLRYVQADTAAMPPAEDPKVSFLATPKRSEPRRWPRVAMGALAVTLMLVLGGQVALHERDRLAAVSPAVKPVLMAACDLLLCEVLPVRHIDAVVIDSSAFAKVRGDVYRLSFTLKNTAVTEIAAPALELTLTDSDDQALARKVVLAKQYLGVTEVQASALKSTSELNATVPVQVKLPSGSQKVSGYRLLAFYP